MFITTSRSLLSGCRGRSVQLNTRLPPSAFSPLPGTVWASISFDLVDMIQCCVFLKTRRFRSWTFSVQAWGNLRRGYRKLIFSEMWHITKNRKVDKVQEIVVMAYFHQKYSSIWAKPSCLSYVSCHGAWTQGLLSFFVRFKVHSATTTNIYSFLGVWRHVV
jgi:hypothetical protein